MKIVFKMGFLDTRIGHYEFCFIIFRLLTKKRIKQKRACIREDIQREKPLTFGHCPKGGGSTQIQKFWGVVFLGLSFGHFPKKGRGVEPIPKVLG